MLPSCIAFFLDSQTKQLFSKHNSLTEKYFQISINKIKRTFGNVKIFSNSFEHFKGSYFIAEDNELNFIREILNFLPKSKLNDPDLDEVYFAYFEGLCPGLSQSLTSELNKRHYKYLSQYSYSENLPNGIVPRFLSREFILTLPDSLDVSVHDFLFKNINEYDIEIFYQNPDLRYYRLDFSASNRRSLWLIKDFLNFKKDFEYEEIPSILSQNLHFFRKAPSYIEVEVSQKTEVNPNFSAYDLFRFDENGFLKIETLQSLISQLDLDFQTDYTVSFAGCGEPLENPNFLNLVKLALNGKYLKELIIETYLYNKIDLVLEKIEKLDQLSNHKITFIINLTTLKSETYSRIYQRDYFEQVYKNLEALANKISKKQIYLQFMKIMELEEELDGYYKKIESLGFGIILQKYNSYCGNLPEKRAADLTPLQREFCWHLNRDIYINFDGSVAFCKQVPNRIIGNLSKDSLKEIWFNNQDAFNLSFHGKTELIEGPCIKCDEWYTFNA